MKELLQELLKMVEKGTLQVEGVTIDNNMREIELGSGVIDGFDGSIKLNVTSEYDVIKLGNILVEAMKDGNNG